MKTRRDLDRSRSPNPKNAKSNSGGSRRWETNDSVPNNANNGAGDMSNMMNQQMMMNPNMMMGQGNMMMPNMYGNMMMPNMMNNMMGSGMDMSAMNTSMNTSADMSMMPQQSMDMTSMNNMSSMNTSMPASNIAAPMNNMAPPMNTPIPAPPLPPGPPPGMDLTSMGMMGGMMGGIMDPSMMGNMNMGMYGMSGDMPKEIVLKLCKLSPPPPGSTPPSKRVKPFGCRTIFVGGLPEAAKENVVREIFENYGRINTLRLSTKNFCHIRFERESCVDAAMMISGYKIKLINSDDGMEEDDNKQNSGWLHVDYALSRDDQNEYERRQRQAMRQQEAQMQTLTAQQQALAAVENPRWPLRRRSPSPLRIQPFSGGAILQLCEKVKSEEHFQTTLPTLIAWLERGECSKKNASQFYSMIQATNAHIRRLYNEKIMAEDELNTCKERIKHTIQSVIEQLEQVAKVFTAATHQRVWDHFTKPQRKNIETWQKMSQEFITMKEEFNEKFLADEIDGYNNGYNMKPLEMGSSNSNVDINLKMENESLKFQLEAYKNEVDVIKADASKELEKFKAQFIARQALQGAFGGDSKPPPPPPTPLSKPPPPPPLPDDLDSKVHLKEKVEAGCGEGKLIGVMAAFLQVHPQGASLDYVVSYVRALFPHVSQATIHHVLQKHSDVFERTTSGVGANIEHRWSFVAFQNRDEVKAE